MRPFDVTRSTLHLCQIAAELERKGVNLQVIDQHINTNDATGRLLFNHRGLGGQWMRRIRISGTNRGQK